MSKQDAAATQVAEKALAAVRAGRAQVEWGVNKDADPTQIWSPQRGAWGRDGTVMQPGHEYPLDTGRRLYEVTIRWAE